eukprot:TRINITY_DN24673_c0_g1_i2.p1 TRINITY_DN24673_c0_g1~~TRINITY_DN24673_c0_g1_i2.p1  ORF type:complete len:149 (+),score=37.09 TRINITY_DN24673_c0_g1_i2:88-534(+)
MIRRPPRSTQGVSSAASDVYKRQGINAEYMGAEYMGSSSQSILLQTRGAGVLLKTAEHLQNKQINVMKDMKSAIQSIEAILTAVTGTHKDYSFILADVITLCELLRDSETGTVSRVKFNLAVTKIISCLLYTSPSPRDLSTSRMPSSA